MPIVSRAQKFNPDGTAHGQGSWFAIADSKNRGVKIPGFRSVNGIKGVPHRTKGHWTNPAEHENGPKNGGDWFASGEDCSLARQFGSKSMGRKAASAMIAKIPLPLSTHIAKVFKQCTP